LLTDISHALIVVWLLVDHGSAGPQPGF